MTTHGDIIPLREQAADPYRDLANVELEQALLGALMMNNRAHEHVCDLVQREDFAHPVHGRIYAAIAEVIMNGGEAGPVTLRHVFARDGSLDSIGGAQYLAALVEATVTVSGAPDYARTIADLARRREIVAAVQDIGADAAMPSPERAAAAVIDDAEQRLYEIAERNSDGGAPRPLGEIVAGTVRDIEAAYRAGGAVTVDTGLADVDRIISGMGAGDLVVLAGRPSMGKSALAGSVAVNCARQGKRVAVFSLEMTRAELAQRWIAGLTDITTDQQRHGRLDQHEWNALAEAQRELSRLPIVVDDQPRLSVPMMRQRARRLRRRGGLDLVVIDHLQLVRQPGRQESRRLEIGDATSMLKAVAKEVQVPILLLSQLSRAVEQREDKRPMLSDLRESGDIEQDADVVMLMYREEYYLSRAEPKLMRTSENQETFNIRRERWAEQVELARGLAEVAIAKNRHGRTGVAHIAWIAKRQRFENLAP